MKSYLRTKDHSVTKEEFELHHDTVLDMLITHPRPEHLERYYESDSYISHTDSRTSLVDKLYHMVKRLSLTKKVKLISRYANGTKTLLDLGAGTGDFLATAKQEGWRIVGVEVNSNARNKSSEKGIELLSNLSQVENQKFQIITLWHVLEHLPDLEEYIEMLASKLEEEGTLVIAVPNFKSFDARHYKEYWAAYDVPRHLWHFSRGAIKKMFEPFGFKLVKTKPMIFDSFYVSLLSEKYKSKRQNFFKAMCIGLYSNIKAWGTKEYSSHIYILQKA